MKKTFFYVLIFFLTVSIFPKLTVNAEGVPKIYGDEIRADMGESFVFHVNISDNSGLAAWLVNLTWDSNVLEIDEKSFEDGSAFSKGLMLDNLDPSGTLSVTWFNAKNVTGDGEMFSVKFKLADSVKEGDYSVNISCPGGNTITEDEDIVEPKVVNGSVSVKTNKPEKEKEKDPTEDEAEDSDIPDDTDKEAESKSEDKSSPIGTVDETLNDGLTLNYNRVTISDGKPITLTVAEDVEDLVWTSSDESVATVKDGVVTPVGPGTAEISVNCDKGDSTSTIIVDEEDRFDGGTHVFLFALGFGMVILLLCMFKNGGIRK